MSHAARRRIYLPTLLALLLLGASASMTMDSEEKAELTVEETVLETHSTSNLNFPGMQDGSIYSVTSLTASFQHTCVILNDQTMRCWGDAGQGFLGNNDFWWEYWVPQYVSLGDNGGASYAVETSSWGHHSCTIMIDDAIKCWGEAGHGQLGHGVHGGFHSDPIGVAALYVTPVEIAAGFHHTCSIMDDYSLYCWGDNFYGQVGNNGTLGGADEDVGYPTHIPLPHNRTAIAVNLGGNSGCTILDNGSGMCWGLNDQGQLGDGTQTDRNVPTPITAIPANRTLAALAVSTQTTCAILDNGRAVCWGLNDVGQFGDGTFTNSTSASYVSLPANRTAIAIDSGREHACAILDDNSAWCWGKNLDGQLGDNTTNWSNVPVPVAGNHSFSAISTGYYHTCGILTNASVYCWGYHGGGRLGIGIDVDADEPAWVNLTSGAAGLHGYLGERDHDGDGILSIFDQTPYPPPVCTEGNYLVGYECIDASPGHYVANNGSTEQTPCANGTYQPYSGQNSCYQTDSGYYTDELGSIQQTACSPGSYQPDIGQTSCIDATPGNYSTHSGSISQSVCTAGTYQPNFGQPSCLDADPGHFVLLQMQTNQIPCAPGFYQPIAGQTSCFSASEGHYAPGEASSQQLECEPGTYADRRGFDACDLADPGHYVPGSAAIEQLACSAGFNQPSMGMTECLINDPGYYTSQSGTANPLACPGGSYQPDSGGTGCLDADPGHYAPPPASTSQLPCAVGTYAPTEGTAVCTSADPGYFVAEEGSSGQEACQAGTHQSDSGSSECSENDPGYYTDCLLYTSPSPRD